MSDKENNAPAANLPSAKRARKVGGVRVPPRKKQCRTNGRTKKEKVTATDPTHPVDSNDNCPLRSILKQMHFKKKLIDEAISVASTESENEFYSNMKEHFELIKKNQR